MRSENMAKIALNVVKLFTNIWSR